ncbi:disease resistance RPP13-like protein 4 [Vitis riparia]|uniref:disease resistance RPP13-like protein 4 n=1 Tax=Vitis riparia TaxID=96939 RepID=UPI00155AE58A|nr:disease resistance RPP13-like protein 4 [Vitis riparia]
MPIRRKLEEAVPNLRVLIDEVIKDSKTQDSELTKSKIQPHLEQLQEINAYFDEKGKDLFDDLKETEDELLKNFNALEEKIDDSKYAILDLSRDASVDLDLTKRSIGDIFNKIQEVVSGFQGLPLKERKGSSKNNDSEGQAREISEKWSALKVEHRILEHSVLSRFQLSYDNIIDIDGKEHRIPGRNIKLCLLCFSVFPPKSVIKKRPLIYWWLGEGLITETEDGERIFGELIKKGLLIAKYKPYKNPVVDSCTMHSWNRLMLISVAKRAQFFDFDEDTGLPANHGTSSRRMCLVKQRYLDKQTPPNGEASRQDHNSSGRGASTEHRLLTLFNVNEQYVNISNFSWFSENKIEVLQLGRWQDSAKYHIEVEDEYFLKALGSKKHLKYLSLRGISRITEMPSSVRKLINLEILDLRACHNLEKLPSDISSLKKLTHLDISECHLLESMPKGLEKLTSLQVLKGFVVGTSKRGPCKLENLAELKRLRKLSIYIRNEAYMEELAKLKQFETLCILSITWGERGAQGPKEQSRKQSATSESSFRFPPNLKKLDLWCIPETDPAWLDPAGLQSLSKLYIRGGKLVSFKESPTGKKWGVQILRLKYLRAFDEKKPWRRNFPYLSYLEIVKKAEDEHRASSSRSPEQTN